MKLYEINEQIEALTDQIVIDPETGEVSADTEAIIEQVEALHMERKEVLEYLAKVILNLRADQAAVKAEEARLKERRERMAKREASLMNVLDRECAGQKTDLGVATISYRPSETTEVTDYRKTWMWLAENHHDDCLTLSDPTINKTALKRLIKSGVSVPGAELATHNNCSLK